MDGREKAEGRTQSKTLARGLMMPGKREAMVDFTLAFVTMRRLA